MVARILISKCGGLDWPSGNRTRTFNATHIQNTCFNIVLPSIQSSKSLYSKRPTHKSAVCIFCLSQNKCHKQKPLQWQAWDWMLWWSSCSGGSNFNFNLESGYLGWKYSWFSQLLWELEQYLKTCWNLFLPHISLPFIHPTI
jgi:hypothetical protein